MDTLQQNTEPLPYIPDQANDTGRHHMYRAHQDCAAAVSVRRKIRSAMLGTGWTRGQHRHNRAIQAIADALYGEDDE